MTLKSAAAQKPLPVVLTDVGAAVVVVGVTDVTPIELESRGADVVGAGVVEGLVVVLEVLRADDRPPPLLSMAHRMRTIPTRGRPTKINRRRQ